MHQPYPSRLTRTPLAVRSGTLLAGVVAIQGAGNVLLPRFLGLGGWPALVGGGAVLAVLCAACVRGSDEAVPLRRLGWCLLVGFAVMLLGGEGRVLFATVDWQVRDALLADMVRSPWPFAYAGHGVPLLPRLPIGIYLLPALAGKLGGQRATDLALLAQNGAVLGLLLALGSQLAPDARRRRVLLVTVLAFGGLDIVANAAFHPDHLLPLTTNLEAWAPTILMSNTASAFWAPQHALSAWTGATLFLLWRTGRLPLALFLLPLPLCALWSPLGLAGTMPFVALAGVDTLVRRRLTPRDVLLPALSLGLAAVPLLYLRADAGTVGVAVQRLTPEVWLTFEIVEVLPFLLCALIATRGSRFGTAAVAVAAGWLMVVPFVAVGESVDFCMRAGAPAIAILSVLCADAVADGTGLARRALIALLVVGAMTPAHDVLRALAFRASPAPRCDLFGAWNATFWYQGKETYLARLPALTPPLDRVRPFLVAPLPPTHCWNAPWREPRWPGAARWLGGEWR